MCARQPTVEDRGVSKVKAAAPSLEPRLGWRPGLDGLRGVAILLVMYLHFESEPLLPGGFLGVNMFFVLSGFLITTLLLEEWRDTGRISLRRFYARRALRLLPVAFTFFAVYLLVVVAFGHTAFIDLRITEAAIPLLAAVLYVFNWVAYAGLSGPTNGHLWSLAVEEQFYVVWPGILLLLLSLGVGRRRLLALTLGVALACAALPLLLGGGWARYYFGSDFQAHGPLLGAGVAMLFHWAVIRPDRIRSRAYSAAAALAALVLAFLVTRGHGGTTGMLHYGIQLGSLSSAVILVWALFAERGVAWWAITHPVLRYVGRRSYALYLWHKPIEEWLEVLPHGSRWCWRRCSRSCSLSCPTA